MRALSRRYSPGSSHPDGTQPNFVCASGDVGCPLADKTMLVNWKNPERYAFNLDSTVQAGKMLFSVSRAAGREAGRQRRVA